MNVEIGRAPIFYSFLLALARLLSLPFPIPSAGVSVAMVSEGEYHSCAASSSGTLWCWGRNSDGQLGIGSTDDQNSPVVVKLDAGSACNRG